MEPREANYHFGVTAGNNLLPVPAFSSTFNLLRNYNNYLLSSQSTSEHPHKDLQLSTPSAASNLTLQSPPRGENGPQMPCLDPDIQDKTFLNLLPSKPFIPPPLLGYQHHLQLLQNDQIGSRCSNILSHCPLTAYSMAYKRQRGEKKPIPDEQKDEKYFERRRRNNNAAKKSRDARKIREDQIALRATILEHENALLRAQLLTLREEASSLRQMLLQKKALEIASRESQICRA